MSAVHRHSSESYAVKKEWDRKRKVFVRVAKPAAWSFDYARDCRLPPPPSPVPPLPLLIACARLCAPPHRQ